MLSMDDFPSLKPPFIIICWGFGIVMFYYPISPEGNSSFLKTNIFSCDCVVFNDDLPVDACMPQNLTKIAGGSKARS
jgi:hypothetical protein